MKTRPPLKELPALSIAAWIAAVSSAVPSARTGNSGAARWMALGSSGRVVKTDCADAEAPETRSMAVSHASRHATGRNRRRSVVAAGAVEGVKNAMAAAWYSESVPARGGRRQMHTPEGSTHLQRIQ